MDKTLKAIYYNPNSKGAYGGVRRLWLAVRNKGYKYSDVKNWVEDQETYNLHKPIRKNFTRKRVIVGGIDVQWQADLVDIPEFIKENDGYRYLLTVIDVFSKYSWVVLLRSKHGKVVRDALAAIFAAGRVPTKLQTDSGTEFYNSHVKGLLKKHHISLFSTRNNETKASIVERFNRTLKTDMWRYFTANNTRRYVDIVQNLVAAYNSRFHRSIKMAPNAVTKENSAQVVKNLYGSTLKIKPKDKKLAIGDTVMISKSKRLFEKGYLPNWTYEQFTVAGIVEGRPLLYKLKDYAGDAIDGTFYGAELQKVKRRDVYKIEKIIRRRGQKVLVKWMGYPDSFNQWINREDVESTNQPESLHSL